VTTRLTARLQPLGVAVTGGTLVPVILSLRYATAAFLLEPVARLSCPLAGDILAADACRFVPALDWKAWNWNSLKWRISSTVPPFTTPKPKLQWLQATPTPNILCCACSARLEIVLYSIWSGGANIPKESPDSQRTRRPKRNMPVRGPGRQAAKRRTNRIKARNGVLT
jgi:hypothetical protein